MRSIYLLLLFAITAILTQCSSADSTTGVNKFHNAEILTIARLCDERQSQELTNYFGNPDVTLRREAVLAFASIRDTSFCTPLEKLLSDTDPSVRLACAYALGQCAKAESIDALVDRLNQEVDGAVRGAAYEALGKIAGGCVISNNNSQRLESAINTLDASRFDNEEERLGWAKAAFWLNMAGTADRRLMDRMPFVLQKTLGASRLACAEAMSRFKDARWFQEEKNKSYILAWCKSERSNEVRVLQMSLLGKINDQNAANTLLSYLNSPSQDQAVKVSALRASSKMNDISTKDIISLLQDQDDYVAQECLLALGKKNTKDDIQNIINICRSRNVMLLSSAFGLANKLSGGDQSAEIWSLFQQQQSTYDKVAFALALSGASSHASEMIKAIQEEKEFAVKYALGEAITGMFVRGEWPTSLNYYDYAKQLIESGDIGIQALIASSLRESTIPDIHKKPLHDAFAAAQSKLTLPREIETWNEIVRTINYIGIEKQTEHKVTFNHDIDWDLVRSIPEKQQARIITTKGEFIMDLHINDAPGSVASFVKLVKEGFYDNKHFHRVIPNFVIQGGCPRGDGMGGTDYTLRSEFALHDYSPGAVGLASSGPDTESCQWFVSHISTPHLEGRYTIFAHVSSGLDIVRKINVGDQITKIELLNPKK